MPKISRKIWNELQAHGIATVKITGSGSGDSGEIDEVKINPERELPRKLIATLEEITEDAWSRHFGSYYNDDGGEAEATFDVCKRTLTLQVGYYSINLYWQDAFIAT